MSLSGPATAWAWMQTNISGETWKCASAPIQPDRASDVKRWEEWQITAKFWYAKLLISYPKRLEAVKVLQLSTELRYMKTYAMYLFQFFLLLMNLRSCDNSVFALPWCTEYILMWKKSNSKQLNIRLQHNKTWKNEGVWRVFIGTTYIHT